MVETKVMAQTAQVTPMNQSLANSFYRQNAIDSLNTVDDVATTLKIIEPSAWLWLIACGLILLGMITWGLLGKISLSIESHGIAIDNKQIDIIENNIDKKLQIHKENVADLYDLYTKKINLFNNHYITRIELRKAKEDYLAAKETLDAIKNNLQIPMIFSSITYNNASNLSNYLISSTFTPEVISDPSNPQIASDNINDSSNSQITPDDINNPSNPQITPDDINNPSNPQITPDDINNPSNPQITPDDINNPRNPQITSASSYNKINDLKNSQSIAIIFVEHQLGKKIRPGMPALVLPTSASILDHGYLKGTVISISAYPVSKQLAYEYLQNNSLVDSYFISTVPFMIKIKLDTPILSGSAITAKIKYKTCTPLELLLNNNPF